MSNKFLSRIAEAGSHLSSGVKNAGKSVGDAFKETTPAQRLGLGLGATGLALGVANNIRSTALAKERNSIEEKNLKALHKITKVLESNPGVIADA